MHSSWLKHDLGQENFIPSNLRIGSGFEFLYDSNNSLSITIEVNKLLVPTPNVPIYDSSNSSCSSFSLFSKLRGAIPVFLKSPFSPQNNF